MSLNHDHAHRPLPVILGCSGLELTTQEFDFFLEHQPLGFILFARNIADPVQLSNLVKQILATQKRSFVPILIDQEGGTRVVRLRPPHWPSYPSQGQIGVLAQNDPAGAKQASYLLTRLMADDLQKLGITVDCSPVLDLAIADAHGIIGDRSFGDDPEVISTLGRAACQGFWDGSVIPIVKHIPGHGRAKVDSHEDLPIVETDLATLEATDFKPFKNLSDQAWAMTAHIIYQAIDPAFPATTSRIMIHDWIRGKLGFKGIIISDDLNMKALQGTLSEKTKNVLEAGCDLALHCSGIMAEMQDVVSVLEPMSDDLFERLYVTERLRVSSAKAFDRDEAMKNLNQLIKS